MARKKGNLDRGYPVEVRGQKFDDAEMAFQSLKPKERMEEAAYRSATDALMREILVAKFRQHPQLMEEVAKQGGLPWIEASSHRAQDKNWGGQGRASRFIAALADAYSAASVLAEAAPVEQPRRPSSYDAADLFVAIQEAGLTQRALDASFRIMPGEAIPTESPDAARFAALARIDADEDLDQDTKDELKTAVEVVQLEAWGESADAADRLELFKYEARRKLVYGGDTDRALRVAHFKTMRMDDANKAVDSLKEAFLSRDLDVRQLAWSDLARITKEFKRLRADTRRNEAERQISVREEAQVKLLEKLLPDLMAVEKATLDLFGAITEVDGTVHAAPPEAEALDREGMSADFAGNGKPLGIGWYDPTLDSVTLRRYEDEMEWHQDHSELLGSPPPNGADGFRVYAKGGMFNRIGTVMWTGQPGSQESVHAVETAAAREFGELRRAEFVHKTMSGASVPVAEAVGASIDLAGLPAPAQSRDQFLIRPGDPESDLSRPEGNKTSVALPPLSDEEAKLSVPDEVAAALQEQLGVSNVQVMFREHPYFKDAPAVVDSRNGMIFAKERAALPRAIANYALAVVGESNPMLAAAIAPDIDQALTPTARSNHAGSALSSLLEAEIAARLSGATSLFEDQSHWLPVLADDVADRIENGLRQFLAEAKLVRRGNRLAVAPTDSIRQLAPADRGFAPNDSVPWDKAAASKVVPESLRPRLARAIGPHSAAIEIMGAADRGEIDDVAEDVLLRSAFESLPTAKFPGGIEDPQLRMGMSVDSIYFHDYGSRAALLKRMGIPAMHMAYFEAMNAIHASEINGGSWQETVRMLLDHDSQWLHRIVTDKDGYRHQDRASKVALSKYERQLLMRLEYAVTALMEHADQFDLDNPAVLKQLFEQETIVYGRFQPRFVSGKDRPQGELPEFDKIGNVLREFEASGLKAKMLDPAVGGRTADELDVVKLAKDARARYDEAVLDLNDLTADFLNGGVFMDFRSRFAPHFYGWAPALDPEGSEADRAVARMLKYADPAKSLLKKGDGSIDDSGKDKHQGTVPDWTQVQQDLLQGLDPNAYARGKAMETVPPDGKRTGGPNVVQANRMLANALRKRLYDSAAKHMASAPNPGEWVPTAEDQANLATLKHTTDILRRYHFVESSPAEFSRSHDTFVSAYVGDGTLAKPDRDLRPRTMSFIDLHREYMDRVYAAAAHKAVLNAYLGFTDVDGRPLVMAQPSANIDFEHGAVKRETWERYAANVANYYGDKFDPQGDLAKQLRDLYSKHASKNSTEVIVSPKMPSIQQWSVVGKNAARLLKNIVGLSPTDTYALARGAISAAAWTKTMSFGWSAFFYTSLAESSVSFSGVWDRNLMKQLFSDPKALKSFWSDVKAFREHRRYYRPAIAQKIKYLVDMGMTSSGPAASEQYIGQFQRDMASLAHWMAEKYGKQNADRFMWLMFGDKNETGWKKFWPGLTGSKMSQWMFDWFSAIKEAQTDMYVKQLAASEGYDTGHLVSWNQARFLVNDSNNVMGGQNWARYLKWTPTVRFLANVFFLAPNWTLSAWNASGLGFLTQALFGTYMDPGQARRTWMDYNPAMALWIMLLTPAAIQALMFSIGKAFGGDPDDVPLPLMNEPGRKQYVDITPLVRLFPNYKGGLTGKRRAYIQFAKQVHETGLSNPFGDRGWINEPLNQAMRKLSQPVKLVYEQMTGLSPGSDWQLEFQGKGMLGWITSGEPGAKGFMTSRTGYIVQKFIPMSWSQFIQNPETFPFNHLAPTSKGASQSKIVQNIASVLATYASAKDWHRIRKVPRARAALDSLVPEFLRAAEANGYNPEKVLSTAKGMVLGDLYARMWQALDTNDEALMKATAASIWRVGGALKGLRSSLANKQKSFGIELTPEQLQQAEDAMNWAMYGSE